MTGSSRARRNVMVFATLLAIPEIAQATDDVAFSADPSINAGYANNPFLEQGSGRGSGYVQARIDPEVKFINELTTITVAGMDTYKQYFQHYGSTNDIGAYVDYAGKPSTRLRTHAKLSYDNSIIGQNEFTTGSPDTGLSSAPVTSGSDISLIGTRDRRQQLQAEGGLVYTLSQHTTLTTTAYYVHARYSHLTLGDYDGFGDTTGISRQVAERVQLGVQGSFAYYTYKAGFGHTSIYSPQASFSVGLTSYWKFDGAVGASFVDNSVSGSTTTFTGNINICRNTPRSDFCMTARRAALPTGSGQIQNELLIGTNYSYKITPLSTVTLNANYTQNSAIQSFITGPSKYLRGSVGYDRRVTERVHFTLEARYANIYGTSVHRSADYGAQAGISVKIGRSQ
ncbi:hypothetical protein [Novosphingobium sp.]|uniref:hypothetical protein n=1 Tax=Novosphingobium sp. TaxID=1874826 RepID=UPI003B52069B